VLSHHDVVRYMLQSVLHKVEEVLIVEMSIYHEHGVVLKNLLLNPVWHIGLNLSV